ncbi:MAG: nucleoid-associated protein [Sporocytophaga sp.]|uniref:nucleoid-associated protein n=1 Tax=Sporocytophaga sp. TaxID=2231183 RepID=UPI001AFD72D6|nr:nucleoid-associated protein [Sporocytophaga sp.]MBO9702067.1 nucleoid-associated protein [Sporocytophaga sp.]
MIDFTEVKLHNIVVHNIGNSLQEEGMKLSKGPLVFRESIVKELLMKYFLSPFKGELFYNFFHDTELALNEIYNYVSKIFDDPDCFYLQTINISKHLYDKSNHHNIKGGEFYLVYFADCVINGDSMDAIGLFKSENKDTYLRIFQETDNFEIEHEQGVNINKLDKGCLIFNTNREQGYKICVVDNTNKGQEAQYWKNDFLKIKQHEDNYFHTQNLMKLTKEFCNEVLDKEYEVSKADQIELMNRSVQYFAKKEVFNLNEFQEEVMGNEESMVSAFNTYKEQFQEKNQVNTYDEFNISNGAFKSNKKIFKSILKLDKNFHVYIHGNKEFIERGYDEGRQMHYYQLFFKNETS